MQKYKFIRKDRAIHVDDMPSFQNAEYCYEINLMYRSTKRLDNRQRLIFIGATLVNSYMWESSFRIPLMDVMPINGAPTDVYKDHALSAEIRHAALAEIHHGALEDVTATEVQQSRERMKTHFVFSSLSNTIRLWPQNYVVAEQRSTHDGWTMAPDLACPLDMVIFATIELMRHENKYGTGENLLKQLQKWEAA